MEKSKALSNLLKGASILLETPDEFYSYWNWAIRRDFLLGEDLSSFHIEPSEQNISDIVKDFAESGFAFRNCGFYAVTLAGSPKDRNYVFDLPLFFQVLEVPKVVVDSIEKIIVNFRERRLYVKVMDTAFERNALFGLLCWYDRSDDLLACLMAKEVKIRVDYNEVIEEIIKKLSVK